MVNLLGMLNIGTAISIHALSKKMKEPYTTVRRNVMKLKQMGVLNVSKNGNNDLLSINFNCELTKYILSVYSFYKSKHLNPLFRIIVERFVYDAPLILFGSYAKGIPRQGSDIDLCVIGVSRNDEAAFKKDIRQIELIHKVEINIMFFTKKEFEDMSTAKKHNVGKEILLNSIPLKNADLWFNFISEVHDDIRI